MRPMSEEVPALTGRLRTAIGVAVYAYARKKDQPTFVKALASLAPATAAP